MAIISSEYIKELIIALSKEDGRLKYKLFDKNLFGLIRDFFDSERAKIFYLYNLFNIPPLPLGKDAVLSGSAFEDINT